MAKKKQVEPSDWLEQKIKAINESKMPESQKMDLLKEIGAIQEQDDEGKVPFAVYAKVKAIGKDLHKAMLVYPKAAGVEKATIAEWSEIFKNF